MAKQVGAFKLVGRVENFCCYKMGGDYFIRLQSSLTGKRFWTDKVFEGSRKSCRLLAMASPLASQLYKTLPPEKKGRPVFRALTGKVKLLLEQGFTEAKIVAWFKVNYLAVPLRRKRRITASRKKPLRRRLEVLLPVKGAGRWEGKQRNDRCQCKGAASVFPLFVLTQKVVYAKKSMPP